MEEYLMYKKPTSNTEVGFDFMGDAEHRLYTLPEP